MLKSIDNYQVEVLLTLAAVMARAALGTEIPVGVVTAIVGAPYLIWLITRPNLKERA